MNGKDEVRKKLKAARARFSGEERVLADKAVYENFINNYLGCESFFVFSSFGSEADTKKIISRLIGADKRVYLPRVEGDTMLAVPYGEMQRGAFGIYEPCGQPYSGKIDVAAIPLLAVNGRGYRLGYGKGFYDKFLRGRPEILKVGLGYSFQLSEFNEDGWDIPLDAFVSDTGVIKF